MKKNVVSVLLAALIAGLSACGGGGNEDSPVAASHPETVGSSSATRAEVDALFSAAAVHATPLAGTPKSIGAPGAVDVADGEGIRTDPPPPADCQWMYFGGLGIRCMTFGSTLYPALQGTDATSIMPRNPFCNDLPVGKVVYGVTPAPGALACYQFPIGASTTVNYQVNLPPGVSGIAELHYVNWNTSGYPMTRSATPASSLTGSTTIQYQRLILVIRTSNGTGGKVFGLGVNATVPDPLPPNSVSTAARDIDMNEELITTLPSALDTAYYFFPHKIGQTQALVSATFLPANVQVAYRSAQRTGAATFNVAASETVLTAAQATGSPLVTTSAYPANTSTSTNIGGTMVRVNGLNASVTNPAFTVRVGAKAINIDGGFPVTNTEAITRWFPFPETLLQVATHVVTKVGVKDDTGAWVKNALVQIRIKRFRNDLNSFQDTYYKTTIDGQMSATAAQATSGTSNPVTTPFLAGCSGALTEGTDYGPPGTPREHWNGTAQAAQVSAILPGGTSTLPKYSATSPVNVLRICSETYVDTY